MPYPKLCFLIPAVPTDGFCGQIAMFRKSLDHLGGIYQQAAVVAVFGDPTIEALPVRWRPHFDRIITQHVSPDEYAKREYLATGDARWSSFTDDCDFVIFSDADTLVLRRIDDLLESLQATPAIAGTIAHWTCFQSNGEEPLREWQVLSRACLGHEIPLEYEHTLTTDQTTPSQRRCPFYLNYGFVIAPRKLIELIRSTYLSLTPRVPALLQKPFFSAQVSLTLAIYAHGVPHRAIDMRYNFPNDEMAEALYPESLQDVRVIHYLRTERFDRQQIFASAEEFDRFLNIDLRGSDKVFQDHIRVLTASRYPF